MDEIEVINLFQEQCSVALKMLLETKTLYQSVVVDTAP
jgi:hypothetical protein